MSARGFLGSGDLYIARWNATAGAFDPYEGPFEVTKFEIKANSEIKEQKSKSRTKYGTVIESVNLNQPSDFTVETPEVNKSTIVTALMGNSEVINVAGGTITDEVVVAKLDKWVPLTKKNFQSAGFTVTNSAASTTYVLGTDYEVNYRLGMIKALSSGAIAADESLKVDGTYAALSGTRIAGGVNAQVRAKFLLDGENLVDNLPCECEVWEGVVQPNSPWDMVGDDFNTVSMSGRMKVPAGKDAPFEVRMYDTAAEV